MHIEQKGKVSATGTACRWFTECNYMKFCPTGYQLLNEE